MTFLQMITPLGLAGVVAKGTLLLAIGWCGTLLLRPAPALARHLVWLTAIVGVLLIPVLARIAPMNVAMLPSVAPAADASPSSRVKTADVREPATSTVVAPTSAAGKASPDDTGRAWIPSSGSLAVALWLTIAIALLARLVSGILSVRRIVRRGRALHSAEWMHALTDAATRLNLEIRPRLVMSDQVEMAFAFGTFASTIIVPVSAEEWSNDRRCAVLLHELAHIRRRDLVGHILASIACAVYWFNPFVWVAARRLRVESELASDDVVLESGVRPADYAQHLLDLVTSVGQRAPTVALAMARPKEFEGRLVAILDRANGRWVFGRTQRGAMVGLLGLLTMSIAAVVPVPRSRGALPPVASTPAIASSLLPRDSSPVVHVESRADVPRAKPPAARPAAPMLSEVAVSTLLRFGTAGVINPMIMLLRAADSLHLTGKQADSIATLNRWYLVRLNGIWSPVSSYYVSHPSGSDETSVPDAFRRAPRASMDLLVGLVPKITGLLTDDQRRAMPAGISIYLDSGYLTAIGAGQTSAPGDVFLPNGGQLGGGRRGGGGGAVGAGGRGRVGRGGI